MPPPKVARGLTRHGEQPGQLIALLLAQGAQPETRTDDCVGRLFHDEPPLGVIEASTARPSSGCGVRLIRSAASRRFTSGVTDVACTWSRSPILPRGKAPRREKDSKTKTS